MSTAENLAGKVVSRVEPIFVATTEHRAVDHDRFDSDRVGDEAFRAAWEISNPPEARVAYGPGIEDHDIGGASFRE